MKIMHIITGLGQGGAEAVLYRLVSASPPSLEHVVVSMMGEAYYGSKLRAAGIDVHTLDMPRGRITFSGVLKLRRLIAESRPDVVQTWMYHADLVGGLVARWAGARGVVWNIRHSNFVAGKSSLSSRLVARICATLSNWLPMAIVCCSERATRVHQAIGYRAEKFSIVPNGYDLSCFSPDAKAGARVRQEWGIQPDQTLLGMVARWDPQKDHGNLLQALAQIKDQGAMFHCALVGMGMDKGNATLADKIKRLALEDRIILVGPRDDIHDVMNALDLHVLSSSAGEAFPNTVAEAMACGTPCVVTDVGDAALIVGETGWSVRPRDAHALARAIQEALNTLSSAGVIDRYSRDCRRRIVENFSLEKMVAAYSMIWERSRWV